LSTTGDFSFCANAAVTPRNVRMIKAETFIRLSFSCANMMN
jgi:hypothetical protein